MKGCKANNAGIASVKHINLSKIDIKAGEMTFGQRIELGKIFENQSLNDFQKFTKTFQCLYKYTPDITEVEKLSTHFEEIVTGLRSWIERENTMLQYTPTADEIRAGINELSKKIGEMGTIKALAKNYTTDPDEVLKWQYGKVFTILFTDLEEYKYRLRFEDVIRKK